MCGFGEWRGRSGGYAIQTLGSTLVERVEGSVSNVVGLPVGLLARAGAGALAAGLSRARGDLARFADDFRLEFRRIHKWA